MAAAKKDKLVTISKSELAFLDAFIEYAREEETGESRSITVYLPEEQLAFWVKAIVKGGKWAWKNRWKLVALTQAATDLIGMDAVVRQQLRGTADVEKMAEYAQREYSVDELIKLRENVLRQVRDQSREFQSEGEDEKKS